MPIINEAQQPTQTISVTTSTTTITFDTTVASIYLVSMGANTTFTFTSATTVQAGDRFVLKFTQDSAGTRTATWPSNFKKVGGTLTITTAGAGVDLVEIVFDGTNYLEVGRNLALS